MNPDHAASLRRLRPLRAIVVMLAIAVAPAFADDIKVGTPGVKRICVPSADGRSWECGTADNPPPERGLPDQARPEPAAPPPFLANPNAYSESEPASVVEETPVEQVETEAVAETPEPVAPQADEATAAAAPETVVETPPATVETAAEPATPVETPPEPVADTSTTPESQESAPPETLARPLSDRPAPLAPESGAVASESTPIEPVAEEPVAAEPVAAEPAAAEPVASEAVAPDAYANDASAAALAEPLRGPTEFAALGANRYTVQLARASGVERFAPLVARLGLPPYGVYALAVGTDEAREWILLWSDFASIDEARAAARSLPPNGVRDAWPRRIGPMQEEVRRAGSVSASGAASAAVSARMPGATSTAPASTYQRATAEFAAGVGDAGRFAQLPAASWTVQVGQATTRDEALAMAAARALDPASLYAFAIDLPGGRRWLVVWSQFATVAAARSAQATTPNMTETSARRIGPLQQELRDAGAR